MKGKKNDFAPCVDWMKMHIMHNVYTEHFMKMVLSYENCPAFTWFVHLEVACIFLLKLTKLYNCIKLV